MPQQNLHPHKRRHNHHNRLRPPRHHHSPLRTRHRRTLFLPLTRTPQNLSIAPTMPITRRQHRRVHSRRIMCLGIRRRAKRLSRLPNRERCVRRVEEDESETGCADGDGACVVGLVASDGGHVLFSLEASADGITHRTRWGTLDTLLAIDGKMSRTVHTMCIATYTRGFLSMTWYSSQ